MFIAAVSKRTVQQKIIRPIQQALEPILGRPLSAVVFVHHYIQLQFDGAV
jgi:hypothetical protein